MRVAILTISDSVSSGEREDFPGPRSRRSAAVSAGIHVARCACRTIPQQFGHLRELADSGRVDVILTTGGTGIGPRDNTPEATQAVAERLIPGIAEEMRRKGLEKTPTAILSRGIAAIRAARRLSSICREVPRARLNRWMPLRTCCRTRSKFSTARATTNARCKHCCLCTLQRTQSRSRTAIRANRTAVTVPTVRTLRFHCNIALRFDVDPLGEPVNNG